jgi:predicted MFS family arabinose efflux permease
VLLLDVSDWRTTLLVFGAMLLLVLPLSLPLTTSAQIGAAKKTAAPVLTVRQIFRDALRRASYVLLAVGFAVSGFQLAFINMHLPAHLQDGGFDAASTGWVIATIGLFNIFGSIAVGWLCRRYANRSMLFAIYFLRALAIAVFLLLPLTSINAFLFAAAMGLLWISAVTPVVGLIARTFGTGNLAALYGLAYFFHQVGAFVGVWAGGLVFEHTGSYNAVWWALVGAALVTSVLTLLISEPQGAAPSP